MSYEQLMQHAYQIEEYATRWAIVQHSRHLGDQGPRSWESTADFRADPVYASFSDIPGLFQPFADLPDPASYDPMLSNLDAAVGKLAWGEATQDPVHRRNYAGNITLDKIHGVDAAVTNWTGKAAMAFKSEFVDTFPTIERNQFLLAAALLDCLDAQRAIWVAARKNIDDIAHGVLAALDQMDGCGRNEWPISWTVLACVTGIMAAPLSGGASLTVLAISSAAWVEGANPPEGGPSTTYGGETSEVVISHMREAISKLTKDICDTEAQIAKALNDNAAMVNANRGLFVANRPDLAGATATDIAGPEEMGYSL